VRRFGRSGARRKFLQGRWAVLSVEAKCAGAIDYSKPVHPLLETVVQRRLEARLEQESYLTAPSVDGSDLLYTTNQYVSHVRNLLMPWKERDRALRQKQRYAEWYRRFGAAVKREQQEQRKQ
jgi:hypothetical protein